MEKLLLYALNDENQVSDKCKEIVVRIYDHTQLALYQIENAKNIFTSSIDEVKEKIQVDLKQIEREYISILGIFAAIVLAFVGGITFSSSILQNIGAVSVYRLLLVTDMLAFVLLNVVHMLMKFIFTINGKSMKSFKIVKVNIGCGLIAGLIVIAWLLNVGDLQKYLSDLLIWSR